MPDYKKKRIGFKGKKNNKRVKPQSDIQMNSGNNSDSSKSKIKVVKGNKIARIRRLKIAGLVALTLTVAIVILSFTLPIGIGENLSNLFAFMGGGEYPREIYGAKTLNAVSKGSYYYVLTDTNLCAFSNSGKEIYTNSQDIQIP